MESVLVQQVKGTQLVNVNYQIGDRSVLHCTSIGKVLLAFQDIRVFDQYTSTDLKQYASNTITNREDLARELQIIRSQGYAFDDHELNDSMRCVAVPVFESGGIVTRGISISGPDSRFTLERLNELKVPMLEAARELSGYLGGQPWNSAKIVLNDYVSNPISKCNPRWGLFFPYQGRMSLIIHILIYYFIYC